MATVVQGSIVTMPEYHPEVDSRGLGAYIFDMCTKHADRICQIDAVTGHTETFKSIKCRSVRLAIELQRRGLGKEDVVFCCTGNILDSIIPVVASIFVGAKVSSVDPSMSAKDIRYLIQLVTPTIIFVQEESLKLIEENLPEASLKPQIIVVGRSAHHPVLSSLCEKQPGEELFRPVVVSDIKKETAFITFSSGTTGSPKGICLSHYGVLLSSKCLLLKIHNPSVMFHISTLYWISAVSSFVISIITGSCRVFTSNPDIAHMLQAMQTYKVTWAFLASHYAYRITSLSSVQDYDLSSTLDTLLFGGTALPAEQILKVRKALNNEKVYLSYGMTENSGFVTTFHSRQDRELYLKKPLSCGKFLHSIVYKVVDQDTGLPVGTNQKGEIRYKSPTLMLGYYKQDALSAQEYDEEGFIRTGDVGYYDEDLCVYVVGRIKEMFKYLSWHVLPVSIEKEILNHPAVKEAVAFGVPHEIDGELPAVSAVLEPDYVGHVTVDELLEYVNSRVSEREKLRGGLQIVDSMPRTPTGKPIRSRIREDYLNNEKKHRVKY